MPLNKGGWPGFVFGPLPDITDEIGGYWLSARGTRALTLTWWLH